MKNFSEMAIRVPHILLPKNIKLDEWSVIACDQYTQDTSYWQNVKAATHGKHSTYDLILPEIYLSDASKPDYIKKIHETMRKYIDGDVFGDEICNFIYVERKTNFNRVRKGLMCELDLESYDWHRDSLALVRATEATIPERIPPRKEIRTGAPLETPHIMLLANDKHKLLVEGAGNLAKVREPIYEGELMMNGGSIKGWSVASGEETEAVRNSLEKLASENTDTNGNIFLFAVGDGNHSLATAKAVWDDYKKTIPESKWASSNVRYALVEIVNLYDEGLTFEPIHRVVFGADSVALINHIAKKLGGTVNDCASFDDMAQKVAASTAMFGFVYNDGEKVCYKLMETKINGLAVAQFQPALDEAMADLSANSEVSAVASHSTSDRASAGAGHSASGATSANANHSAGAPVSIDFIHGAEEVKRLGKQAGTTAMLLPPIAKDSFFDTIRNCGVLPRKSFSMGEADEKRFYLECRKLFA